MISVKFAKYGFPYLGKKWVYVQNYPYIRLFRQQDARALVARSNSQYEKRPYAKQDENANLLGIMYEELKLTRMIKSLEQEFE